MLRLQNISRRTLVVSAVAFSLVVTIAAVTYAVGPRRWSVRRQAYRAPATSVMPPRALPQAGPSVGTPTPAIPRPEPPPELDTIIIDEATRPDQATVLREILEIRRRVRLDPSFEGLPNLVTKDVVKSALWNHEESGEDAFKQALEIAGSAEGELSVCKSGRDCEATYKLSISSDCSACDNPASAALRAAARVLDTRANDCEDARAFTRADELREISRQLRQEARKSGQ